MRGDLPILEDSSSDPELATPSNPSSTPSQSTQSSLRATTSHVSTGPVAVLSSTLVEAPSAGAGGVGVVGYLRVCRGVDLDAALTAGEKCELVGMKALVESSLDMALEQELWLDPANEGVMRELFRAALPWPLSSALLWQERRQRRLRCAGGWEPAAGGGGGGAAGEGVARTNTYQADAKEILRAREAYYTLSERLGTQDLFFAERPTSLDAALYSHLAFLLRTPLMRSPMKDTVLGLTPLLRFVERMELRLQRAEADIRAAQAQGAEIPGPPFTRMPPLVPQHPSREKVEELRRRQQERAARVGGRLFVLGQLGAILLYTFYNALPVLEIEEEREDGEDYNDSEDIDGEDDDS